MRLMMRAGWGLGSSLQAGVSKARHESRDRADGEAVLSIQRQLALTDGEQPQLGPVLQRSLVGEQHHADRSSS